MPEAAPSAPERARFATLAQLARDIAVSVGDAIGMEDTAIVTRKRGRANFATAADHAAERAIIDLLHAHDPSVPVLAEESARKELVAAERLGGARDQLPRNRTVRPLRARGALALGHRRPGAHRARGRRGGALAQDGQRRALVRATGRDREPEAGERRGEALVKT